MVQDFFHQQYHLSIGTISSSLHGLVGVTFVTHRHAEQPCIIEGDLTWSSTEQLQEEKLGSSTVERGTRNLCRLVDIHVTGSEICGKTSWDTLKHPICSMYGIFTYIWLKFMVNVGKYSIHGAFGHGNCCWYQVLSAGICPSTGLKLDPSMVGDQGSFPPMACGRPCVAVTQQ